MSAAGYWVSALSAIGAFGTLTGGFTADWMSTSTGDRRTYLWVPAAATLLCVPLQFGAYLSPNMTGAIPYFVAMMFMAAVFFGPSFAMTQALARLHLRSVATSVLLFVQTLVGGFISDRLSTSVGSASLAYALVVVSFFNAWAAVHYVLAAKTIRRDLAEEFLRSA